MIFFGTGKYFEPTDNDPTCATTQSFYGIWDQGSAVSDADLLTQTITNEQIGANYDGHTYDIRTISNHEIDWNSHKGWKLDIVNPSDALNHGERLVNTPILRDGRLIFTSLISSTEACSTTEGGWLYELDWANGGRKEHTFDLNQDNLFDANDYSSISGSATSVGAKKSKVGIPTAPSILQDPGTDSAYKFVSGSSGGIPEKTINHSPEVTPAQGRQSWRQIFNQ